MPIKKIKFSVCILTFLIQILWPRPIQAMWTKCDSPPDQSMVNYEHTVRALAAVMFVVATFGVQIREAIRARLRPAAPEEQVDALVETTRGPPRHPTIGTVLELETFQMSPIAKLALCSDGRQSPGGLTSTGSSGARTPFNGLCDLSPHHQRDASGQSTPRVIFTPPPPFPISAGAENMPRQDSDVSDSSPPSTEGTREYTSPTVQDQERQLGLPTPDSSPPSATNTHRPSPVDEALTPVILSPKACHPKPGNSKL